jgi:eukaryotic-like serine/threonine-protein kinase
MGTVWKAEHAALNSFVAIKLVESAILAHPEALARFMREAQAAAALRSPHVVQIFDYGVDGETPYIAMELLEGENLATRLERQGQLAPVEVAEILSQVCRAVTRAHDNGIVHRDLKPDNIYLTANDDSEVAKVLDFGIAKHTTAGSHGMTHTGAVLGTPYYMSPEQAEGSRDVDFRTDLWALSVIAYQAIVGRRPFDEESIGALILAICTRSIPKPSEQARVPPGFDEWFARGVARDKSQRFESARELARTLRVVCGLENPAQRAPQRQETDTKVSAGSEYDSGGVRTFAGTSAVGSLSRSIHDEPVAPPMNKLGWPAMAVGATLVAGIVLGGVWLLKTRASVAGHASPSAITADSAASATRDAGLGQGLNAATHAAESAPSVVANAGVVPIDAVPSSTGQKTPTSVPHAPVNRVGTGKPQPHPASAGTGTAPPTHPSAHPVNLGI